MNFSLDCHLLWQTGQSSFTSSHQMVLSSHVVVECVLTRDLNQAELALIPLDLATLLLVVGSVLVGLHLVPCPDPHVAHITVQLLFGRICTSLPMIQP